jgi:uncharacterized protein
MEHIDKEDKGFFRVVADERTAGKMTYSRAGLERIIIDHTEVNPDFNGQGVGKKMVLAAIDFARKENLKIIPLCPFAKSVFDKNPELRDVL